MQGKMCTNFLLEIRTLVSELKILSENGSLALQEWKRVKKRELSLEEYQSAEERILKNCSIVEEIYSNLTFEILIKVRQAEEFLDDEELERLKKVIWHDIQQIFLSWDHYQYHKKDG